MTTETIYVRGPKRLLADFQWFLCFSENLMRSGQHSERQRFLRHVLSKAGHFLVFLAFGASYFITGGVSIHALLVLGAALAFLVYVRLMDITRRIRPLNVGRLSQGTVTQVWPGRGHWHVEVRSMGLVFACHVPYVLGGRKLQLGEEVVLARHPEDKWIAAVVNATPGAIFTEARRAECARFLSRHIRGR